MIFKWETNKERIHRHMKMKPIKKLEWLYQMNEFVNKFSSKKTRKIRQKLRAAN